MDVNPGSSHSAWSSMRKEIFSMPGLRAILVGAITVRRAEPIDQEVICMTRAPGYEACRLRNPENSLSISRYTSEDDHF